MQRSTTLLALTVAAVLCAPTHAFGSALSELSSTDFAGAAKTDKGVAFTLDMGTRRSNWTNARWSVNNLDKAIDLSKFNAVRVTIHTDKPRTDAGVYIALKEADGSWYSHPWVVGLHKADNAGVGRFTDFELPLYHNPSGGSFKDENGILDVDKVAAVAIGCVNPLGVGEVKFTVRKIEFIKVDEPATKPIEVNVTGKLIDINGTSMVPAGIFGSFNLKGVPKGDPYITVDGKQVVIKGKQVEIEGKQYKVGKRDVRVGKKKYRIERPQTLRTTRYRLASDRRIHYSFISNPSKGYGLTHMVIDSVGDRTQPSFRLVSSNWKEQAQSAGNAYGQAAKASGQTAYIEFWNEPYLNWANNNRKNFDPRHYDESKAKEGGPVHIKHDGQVVPHLRWTMDHTKPTWNWTGNLQEWRRGKDDSGRWTLPYAMPYQGWYPGKWRQACAELNPPDDVKDGEKYKAKNGKEYTAFTPWYVYDETQFTYWSGAGMLKLYVEPMVEYFTAIKAAAGDDVVTIVGWGNRPSEDHWAGFKQLYKPTIDAGHKVIDAINDHDYGSDPTNLPASYEVCTAYGVTRYDKWLYAYNTECASSTDPQVYAGDATLSADAGKFEWVTRKIVHTLDFVPGKARNLAHFGVGGGFWSDGGEGVAMDMLRNVRGKLVQVTNSDDRLYVVSCIDGTDPKNPRPDDMPDRKELVVVVLNDHKQARDIVLSIAAPQGTQFDGQPVLRTMVLKDGQPTINEKKLDAQGGAKYAYQGKLGARRLMTLTFALKGDEAAKPQVIRKQFFGKAILEEVTPKQSLSQQIDIDKALLAKAEHAWLKIVVERVGQGEGVVMLNGKSYTLPTSVTPENTAWVRRIPVALDDVKASNAIEFKVADDSHAGYLVGMCSLVIETK